MSKKFRILDKVNIRKIISHHFDTMRNANTNKLGADDLFTFVIIPLAITGVLLYFDVSLKNDAVSNIITTLSIFVGLLFNVIVLIFDIIKRDNTDTVKNAVLTEILANISFTILLSIVTILSILLTYCENDQVAIVARAVVFFFLSLFLLTVLMILKRMYSLFHNEIIEDSKEE